MAEELSVVKSWPATFPGFDPTSDEADVLGEIKRRESGGDYRAKNPGSSASGAYQFIDSTWRLASDQTGVPKYATAAQAPKDVQDANALYMLRNYGPDAKITWAASGPYGPAGATRSASAQNGPDILDRITRGEKVSITPQDVMQIAFGPTGAQAAPAPAAQAKPDAQAPLTVVKSWAPPKPAEPSPVQKAGTAFWENFAPQLTGVRDLTAAASLNPEGFTRAGEAINNFLQGIATELPGWTPWGGFRQGRSLTEAATAGNALRRGDVSGYVRHVIGAIPTIGAPELQIGQDIDRNDPAAATGHSFALVAPLALPEVVPPVVRAIDTATTFAGGAIPPALKAATRRPPYGAALIGGAIGGPKGAALAATLAKAPSVIRAGMAGGRGALEAEAAAAAQGAAADAAVAAAAREAQDAALARGAQAYDAWEAMTQPRPQLPAGPIITPQPADASGVTAVPAQYPELQPGFTPPATTPSTTTTPWTGAPAPEPAAAPPASGLSFNDLATSLTGKSPSRLTQAERATVQGIYDRMTNPPAETAPPPRAAPVPPATPVPPETPPAMPPIAAQEPPIAPAAPAAAPTVPPDAATSPLPAAGTQGIPLTPGMTPAEAQAAFDAIKSGSVLGPLPEDVPAHYRPLQLREGTSNATRAYLKDRRVAEYVLSKGITPEDWESMPLDQQNQLIVEAPTASGKGRHRPFLEEAKGMGRGAAEGVQNIADTMRAIQDRGEGPAPAPAAAPVEPAPPAGGAASELEQQLAQSLQAAQARKAAPITPAQAGPSLEQLAQKVADGTATRKEQFDFLTSGDPDMAEMIDAAVKNDPRLDQLAQQRPELQHVVSLAKDAADFSQSHPELKGASEQAIHDAWMARGQVTPAEATQAFQEAKATPEPPANAGGLSQTLQDAADAAIERMRKRGTFTGNRPGALPLDDAADLAVWGAAKLAQGTVNFAKWSKEMLADVAEIHGLAAAEALKAQLADVYAKSQKHYDRYLAKVGGSLPNTRKLLDMYQKGIEGQDWYDKTWKELQGYFGPDAERFIDFLSATSPNQTVPGNVTAALKAYMQWKNGQPFEGYMPVVKDMLNQAVAGEPFGGPKVSSFKKNLMGDPIPVTVDRWIARAFGFGDQPTPAQYRFMDFIITQAARRKGVEPRQFQAAIWKTMRDAAEQSSSGEAFEVVLRKRLMKDPDLAATINSLSRVQP